MKFIVNVAKRLKLARIACGYPTAKKFTVAYNIPASTYSQHENAKRALSLENIIYYADLLQINHIWLITGQGNPMLSNTQNAIREKIHIEQEKLYISGELDADEIPRISFDDQYSIVNSKLLKTIFYELLLMQKKVPQIQNEEVVAFCFELYNRILLINVNEYDKQKLIKNCLESFFNGLEVRASDEILKDIAIAV